VRERGSGFVAAAYQHRTSRAQDPHLHTHVIVANMARSPDGEWRALDGEPILKHYRLAAGYLYQSQLRFELTRSLGVEWQQPENGMAEIAGVPEGALRAFSQRRAQVLDYLERRGSSGFYAAKVAAIETRDRKEPIDLPRLRLEWEARAAEHGLGRRQVKRLLRRTVERELDQHDVGKVATKLVGPEGLTEKRSTFSGADAVMAWAQSHTQGAPAERVLSLVGRFIGMEQVAPVWPAAIGRPAVFSTAELLRHERAAIGLAAHSRHTRAPTVSRATIDQVVRERAATLGREQATMLRAAASSPDRVVCVVGQAGAGKTTALAALADAFQRNGFVAIGAAPSGVAAANLGARPASRPARSTASSPRRDAAAVSRGVAYSSSTKPEWPTPGRSPACSSRWSTLEGRPFSSATQPSYPPSALAASSPRSWNGPGRSSCATTTASGTNSNGTRSSCCARGEAAITSPTRPNKEGSSSLTIAPRRRRNS
jgi:hypothetical protein